MDTKLEVGVYGAGIGDYLVCTPVFKVVKDTIMWLYEHPKSHRNSAVFDGLCEIRFTEDKSKLMFPESRHPHNAQKKIEGLGISHLVNCVPQVKLTINEIAWAHEIFDRYHPAVAFVADTNGAHDPDDVQARYRMFNDWEWILKEYRQQYNILQFGLPNKISRYVGVDRVFDNLTVRQLLAAYHVIGKYLGVDTGDKHAMLSVGGKCNVLVPPSAPWYLHAQWHYTNDLWKDESPRIKYIGFDDADTIIFHESC